MTGSFRAFLAVGGLAALVNWGSRFAFEPYLGLSGSVTAAYGVGMVTAYSLNRLFVFQPSGRNVGHEAVRFGFVNLLALVLVWVATIGLAQAVFPAVGFTWHPLAVAHGLGVLSPAVTSYLGHKHFTFAPVSRAREDRAKAVRRLRLWARALRLHQWSKNILLFVPLWLGDRAGDPAVWTRCVLGFLLFGVAASATYLINDLVDVDADRRHRTKRLRPLARGDLSVRRARQVCGVTLTGALVGACLLSLSFASVLAAYLVVTLWYSFVLKRYIIVDVLTLAGLYTIRLVCGASLVGPTHSAWLLTFSMALFLALSLTKRFVEVTKTETPPGVRLPGRGYSSSDGPLILTLGLAASVAAVLIIVQYLRAEAFPSHVYAHPRALWATPVLLALWMGRIWSVAIAGALDDDPVAFALRDKASLALGVCVGANLLLARC